MTQPHVESQRKESTGPAEERVQSSEPSEQVASVLGVTAVTESPGPYPPGTPLGISGHPLGPLKPTDRNGHEYNSYDTAGEHAEILTIPDWFPIASLRGKVLWDGIFSCYYDIHLGINAFLAGWRTKQNEDVPKCPPLWAPKEHYWGIADIAYDIKRGSQGAIIGGAIMILTLLKTYGVI